MEVPINILLKGSRALIQKDLAIAFDEGVYKEEDILDILADFVLYKAERNLEQLFSLLYRLDIDEAKVHKAFSPESKEAANLVIAKLILDRQKAKVRSRILYQQESSDEEGVELW